MLVKLAPIRISITFQFPPYIMNFPYLANTNLVYTYIREQTNMKHADKHIDSIRAKLFLA